MTCTGAARSSVGVRKPPFERKALGITLPHLRLKRSMRRRLQPALPTSVEFAARFRAGRLRLPRTSSPAPPEVFGPIPRPVPAWRLPRPPPLQCRGGLGKTVFELPRGGFRPVPASFHSFRPCSQLVQFERQPGPLTIHIGKLPLLGADHFQPRMALRFGRQQPILQPPDHALADSVRPPFPPAVAGGSRLPRQVRCAGGRVRTPAALSLDHVQPRTAVGVGRLQTILLLPDHALVDSLSACFSASRSRRVSPVDASSLRCGRVRPVAALEPRSHPTSHGGPCRTPATDLAAPEPCPGRFCLGLLFRQPLPEGLACRGKFVALAVEFSQLPRLGVDDVQPRPAVRIRFRQQGVSLPGTSVRRGRGMQFGLFKFCPDDPGRARPVNCGRFGVPPNAPAAPQSSRAALNSHCARPRMPH